MQGTMIFTTTRNVTRDEARLLDKMQRHAIGTMGTSASFAFGTKLACSGAFPEEASLN
jgi:hypothetical protein